MFTSRRITVMGGDKFRDEFSLAFDGADEYIDLGSQAGDLRLSGSNGSIFAWVKPELTGDDYQRVVDKSDEANAANGYAMLIHDDGQLRGAMDGATRVYSSTGALKANEWAHVGYSWNGSMHYVWINGELAASASDTTMPPSDTTNMRIGTWNHAAAREFKGKISEVVIYSTAFSSVSVRTVYNSREPYDHANGIAQSALEAWYRMGDGRFDQKQTDDLDGGIVCDMNNVSLGSDVLGGKGDFSDASYWSLSTGDTSLIEITGGNLLFKDSGSTNYHCTKTGVLTAGKVYRCDITITANSGTRVLIDDDNPYIKTHSNNGQTGTFTVYWRPTETFFRLYRYDGVGENYDQTATVSNVVVREVTGGNHGNMANMSVDNIQGDTP